MSRIASPSILVCGAGPTGLVTAIELARRGVDVEIVDEAATPSTLSKAAAIWRRTLEVLHGSVPAATFVEPGRILSGIRLEVDGRVLREVAFPSASGTFPQGLLLPQSETERILSQALNRLGVSVRRDCRLASLSSESDGVHVDFVESGNQRRRRFDWVVGADGAHSAVRHAMGIDFPGESVNRRWLLADLDLADAGPDDKLRAFLASEGMIALFPYGGERWRLIADGGPVAPETPRRDPDRAEIEAILRRRTGVPWSIRETHWLADFRVSERQIERYRHGRILLAGDAAHVHSPAGGQGMNTSIQDAVNLAWKLALVAQGVCDERLLDTYDAERHPVAAEVLRDSGRMLRAAMNQGAVVGWMKRHVLPRILGFGRIQRRVVRSLSEVGVHYHGGPLGSSNWDRWIGRRCPDRPFDGMPTVYDLLRDPRLCVIELGAVLPEAADRPSWRALDVHWHRAADADGSISESAAAFAKTLGVDHPSLVVLRPDGYLGPVGATIDQVSDWIETLRVK